MIKLKESDRLDTLQKAFDQDRSQTISEVYRCYRQSFLRFAQSFALEKETVVDCFQEAVIGLYENLVSTKITNLDNTVKTYLFAIGKNKLLNAIHRHKKPIPIDQVQFKADESTETSRDYSGLIQTAFEKLGDSCQDILIKFYYERYSINAIMYEMNYKNENTAKAHKSRCLKKLRDVFKSIMSDS